MTAPTVTLTKTETATATVGPPPVPKKYTIFYVVHGGIAHPAWRANKKGVDAAVAMIPEADIRYVGPETYSLEEFLSYVTTAVAANPDGLVVTMTAPDAMVPILKDYKGVITEVNTGGSAPPTIPTLTYVGYKPYDTGQFAAAKMAEMAKARGLTFRRTVYANHHPGAIHIEQWGKGFIDASKAMGLQSESLDVTADAQKGAEVMLAYERAHPDLDFIYYASIEHCEALLRRNEEEGIKMNMGTFDFTPEMMDFIAQGKVWFTQDQQMYLQGLYGVMATYVNLTYKFVTPRMITTIGFVTPENAEEFKGFAEIGVR